MIFSMFPPFRDICGACSEQTAPRPSGQMEVQCACTFIRGGELERHSLSNHGECGHRRTVTWRTEGICQLIETYDVSYSKKASSAERSAAVDGSTTTGTSMSAALNLSRSRPASHGSTS